MNNQYILYYKNYLFIYIDLMFNNQFIQQNQFHRINFIFLLKK